MEWGRARPALVAAVGTALMLSGLCPQDDVFFSLVQPPGTGCAEHRHTGSPGDPESRAEAFGALPELGSPSKGTFRLESRVICLI